MKFLPIAVFIPLVAGCSDSSTDVTAQKSSPHFTAVTFVMPHEYVGPACNGDVVTMVGESHVVFSTTADGAGGFYIRTQTNSKTSGTGVPSLMFYQGKQESTDLIYAKHGATFMLVETIKVKGTLPHDDFLLHTVHKITINDDGLSEPSPDQAFIKCGGETIAPNVSEPGLP